MKRILCSCWLPWVASQGCIQCKDTWWLVPMVQSCVWNDRKIKTMPLCYPPRFEIHEWINNLTNAAEGGNITGMLLVILRNSKFDPFCSEGIPADVKSPNAKFHRVCVHSKFYQNFKSPLTYQMVDNTSRAVTNEKSCLRSSRHSLCLIQRKNAKSLTCF